ncbi:DUF3168 domain-containing protein [Rhizobium sp. P32RR-XVIII]|uniref:DUF3168 domain-containing protein n=1 Tax=Rhizobium sp. P32RR-XVIII TaxID=2726738 RepID=UPI001457932A|nr:DUF3168 domain-containing protein [Rhizobium sp. P32RR-XVIII]NLS07610.1 DUF3168 domain-containing protein [Rhizobium sp. P32RR-XVIII]
MSAGKELWAAIYGALKANAALVAMVDGIHDKAPEQPWGAQNTYVSRGPFYGSSDDAECIYGQEITAQIDIWSRKPSRWAVDDIIAEVRQSLHEQEFPLDEMALATIEVRLWRVIDDPEPTTQHGIVQVVALLEEPA